MSTMNAPPPPIPDQLPKDSPTPATNDTPPVPRGDAKVSDVLANVQNGADEYVRRLAEAEAKRRADEAEAQRQADERKRQADELARQADAQQKAETWTVAQYQAATSRLNTNAALRFTGWTAGLSLLGIGIAHLLTRKGGKK